MTHPTWAETRGRISVAFKGEPIVSQAMHHKLEQAYAANPTKVLSLYPSIAEKLANGTLRSGWAVLAKAAAPNTIVEANPLEARAQRIRNTDQWLRTAGAHFPTWNECWDELFGDRGKLKDLHDAALELRYRNAYLSLQPTEEAA